MANEVKIKCPYDSTTVEVTDPTVLPTGWHENARPQVAGLFAGLVSWAHDAGDHSWANFLSPPVLKENLELEQGSGAPAPPPP